MVEIVLCSLVWGFVLYGMWRGYRRAQRIDRYVLITWTIFTSLGVVFTLRIQAVQPFIDAYFHDYPVTFLVSLLAVLAATAAYSLTLLWLVQRSPGLYRLRWFHLRLIQATLGITGSLLGLMAMHVAGCVSSFRVQYMMKWLVEGYGLLQSALVFVPINAAMFRQERVFPMRVKHLATLVLTTTFAISAAFSVIFIPPIIFTSHPNQGPYVIPRGLIAALCLVIILVPHRWLALLLLPPRLRRYARLADTERQIEKLVSIRREAPVWSFVFDPEEVELAIYVTVINILDHYRRVALGDPRGCELVAQIDALWPECAGYDELVEGLCRIRL
ncbi:MAG: hypothetical protein KJ047_05235 [Anaerolineae bacterium]|nr:hypothetical protein [Anaerolineae bacterium]